MSDDLRGWMGQEWIADQDHQRRQRIRRLLVLGVWLAGTVVAGLVAGLGTLCHALFADKSRDVLLEQFVGGVVGGPAGAGLAAAVVVVFMFCTTVQAARPSLGKAVAALARSQREDNCDDYCDLPFERILLVAWILGAVAGVTWGATRGLSGAIVPDAVALVLSSIGATSAMVVTWFVTRALAGVKRPPPD